MGQAVSSVLLHSNTRDLRLEGAILHAIVQVLPKLPDTGSAVVTQGPITIKWEPATFPLDLILGNINGAFQYGCKGFSQSARNIQLDGTVLSAELRTEAGEWKHSSIDLDDKLYVSVDGALCAKEVPVVVPVPKVSPYIFQHMSVSTSSNNIDGAYKAAEEAVLRQFGQMLDKNPSVKIAALNYPDGTTTFIASESKPESAFGGYTNHDDNDPNAKVGYIRVGIDIDGEDPNAVFKSLDASAKAAVFHVADTKGHPITQFSVDMLSAKASASVGGVAGGNDGFPAYAGVDAKVNLVDVQASVFDLNIGLGVQTDIGLKDYSVGGHLAGCGFTVGKKTSISAFGSSFGIDFGRLFG
ncbi:hypothetical protein MMC17_000087 [Xylographa soralifera]|nr:hypothetical protein [Xylographa soralifera]